MDAQVLAAVPTPFQSDGSLALGVADRLLERLADEVDGVFLAGTNGEFAALHPAERRALAEVALRHLRPDRLVVHVGAASTWAAIEVVRELADLPVERFAALTPMVHRVSPTTVLEHFAALREVIGSRTLYAYVFPDVAGNDLQPDRYAELGDVVDGLKVSGSSCAIAADYLAARPGAPVWTGDDAALVSHSALGGTGTVSGCASVLPRSWAALARAVRDGTDPTSAQERVREVVRTVGASIAHLRIALSLTGIDVGPARMSFDAVHPDEVERLREVVAVEAALARP